ncbi:MAG: hypothetical protein GXO76_06430 [Calditrichaeota bacterium]|nr:hypothetical protein [Calditrichota bacterium]
MKSRKWVLISLIVFLVVVVGIQLSWKIFSINDRLLTLLLGEIKPNVQGNVSIEKLEVKLGTIHLKGIKIEWENQPYIVDVKDLRLGFNLFNLLKYNFNPLRFISDIVVDHPRFVFKYSPHMLTYTQKGKKASVDSLTKETLPDKYRQRLIDFKFVGRIVMTQGVVGIQDSSGKTHEIIQNLDGWINTENLSKAIVRMNGRFLGARQDNLGVNGQINVKRGILDSLRLNIINSNLTQAFPEKILRQFKIRRGEMSGRLLLTEKNPKLPQKLNLSGSVQLRKVDVDFLNGRIPVRNLSYTIKIRHWNAELIEATQDVLGKQIRVEGKITNILNPNLHLSLVSEAFKVRDILKTVAPRWKRKIAGTVRATVQVSGAASNPEISGSLFGAGLSFNGLPVHRAAILFSWKKSKLSVKHAVLKSRELRATLSGHLTQPGKKANAVFAYRIHGDILPLLKTAPLRNVDKLLLSLNGNLRIEKGSLVNACAFSMTGVGEKIDSLQVAGSSTYQNRFFQLTLKEPKGTFRGRLTLAYNQPKPVLDAELLHLGGTFWDVLPVPFEKHLKKHLTVSLKINGQNSNYAYTVVAERKNTESLIPSLFQVDGAIAVKNREATVSGSIQYFPLSGAAVSGDIHLKIDPKTVALQEYRLGNYYYMTGTLNRKNQAIKAQIQIDRAQLSHVFDGILLQPILNVHGYMTGLVSLWGTLSDPKVVGQLNLKQGIFNGYGYYNGLISFEFAEKLFRVDQLVLNRDREQILAVIGETNISDRELNFQIHGKNVDMKFLSQLFGSRFNFLSGRSTFDLSLLDRWESPDIRGHLEFRKGRLFFVNYDRMSVDLGKNPSEVNNGSGQSGIRIRKMTLIREHKFTVHSTAFFPFSNNREMDVRIKGNGDFLALLLENIPFFSRTASQSAFSFSIGGTYGAPIYTGGAVDFKKGEIDFQDVLPPARNLAGQVRLEPEGQFIHILRLTGKLAGEPIVMKSFGQDLKSRRPLEPLIIHSWGLNFGVIGLRTGQKGIPVHIPGMMGKGEKIWVVAKGKTPEEYFYLAGPSEHPTLRGFAYIRDGNITYPFNEAKKKTEKKNEKPDFITDVLNRMVWDITVMPQKNVHYVKSIAGLLDKVWINAIVTSPENGLHFSGTISDQTFRIVGKIESTRGTIEYLDLNFSVEKFGVEFDRSQILPIIYGRARTTVTDSTGFPYNIYLTLYTVDPVTKIEQERGRWGQIHFRLSTDNPNIGTSEGQILTSLGYYSLGYSSKSNAKLRSMATDVIGISADRLLLRPLFRPVERRLEAALHVDMVSFRSRFAQNMIELNYNRDIYYSRQIDPRYLIFRSTQLTIGKYLKNNLFLLYSGEIEAGLDPRYQEKGVGLKHTFDLEYRIKPNLLLELQYNYDSLLLLHKQDLRLQVRYSFMF